MKQNEKGFTLIEVLVSITLLVIIITPLLSLFIQGFGNNQYARANTVAVGLAQQQMEELKAEGLRNIKANILEDGLDYDSRLDESWDVEIDGFTIDYELNLIYETIGQIENIERLQIDVFVLWEDKRNNEVVLQSYLANR